MSDARWFEIDAAVAAAVRHFTGACAIFAKVPATIGDEDRYLVEMAFLHATVAGQNRSRSTVAGGIIVKTTTRPSWRRRWSRPVAWVAGLIPIGVRISYRQRIFWSDVS